MLVADGVGGSAAGEVASRTAIQALVDLVLETPDWIMLLDDRLADEVLQRMERRFQRIRETLVDRAKADPKLRGMATTMTVAATVGLGASDRARRRLARVRLPQERPPRTADPGPDDGPVARRLGGDPRGGDRDEPYRNVLTSALATRGAFVQVELKRSQLRDGDRVLLCSDGLTDLVPDETIAAPREDALLGRRLSRARGLRARSGRQGQRDGRDRAGLDPREGASPRASAGA